MRKIFALIFIVCQSVLVGCDKYLICKRAVNNATTVVSRLSPLSDKSASRLSPHLIKAKNLDQYM